MMVLILFEELNFNQAQDVLRTMMVLFNGLGFHPGAVLRNTPEALRQHTP